MCQCVAMANDNGYYCNLSMPGVMANVMKTMISSSICGNIV